MPWFHVYQKTNGLHLNDEFMFLTNHAYCLCHVDLSQTRQLIDPNMYWFSNSRLFSFVNSSGCNNELVSLLNSQIPCGELNLFVAIFS